MTDQEIPMSPEEARLMALEVSNERRQIDEEIHSLMEVLRSQNATMNSPLLDSQGFPIASLDIVAIRNARARLIALRNDRESVENRMRSLLDIALARGGNSIASPVNNNSSTNGTANQSTSSNGITQAMANVPGTNGALSMSVPVSQNGGHEAWSEVGGLTPFARVNAVSPNSPAQAADLRVGDIILKFGEINATTVHAVPANRDLINLTSVVQRGRELTITVLRNQHSDQQSQEAPQVKILRLTPMDGWGGRGLLGCHLLPV